MTGAFTYTPDADVNGSDTFTFVVTDGERQSNPAMVTVKIVEVNDSDTVTIGTVQSLRWNHNLGEHAFVRLELSRDGGATWEAIAPAVQNVSDHNGAVNWLVSGPATASALVRVTSLSTNVSDVSKRPFTIALSSTPP